MVYSVQEEANVVTLQLINFGVGLPRQSLTGSWLQHVCLYIKYICGFLWHYFLMLLFRLKHPQKEAVALGLAILLFKHQKRTGLSSVLYHEKQYSNEEDIMALCISACCFGR